MTAEEAVRSIMTRFHAVWTPKPYKFEDVPNSAALQTVIDSESAPWARVQIKHNTADQRTLGGPDTRRFEYMGIVLIEIYTPSGGGMVQARALAEAVKNAYEGISEANSVWYRNVRFNEQPPSGHWSHVNVIAEFQYSNIR